MKNKSVKSIVSLLLLFVMMFNLVACSGGDKVRNTQIKSENVMADVEPNEIETLEDLTDYNPMVCDFALRLFRESASGEGNELISPVSVLCALSMTMNGADGDTLEQMQEVLGIDKEELNLYIYSYMEGLPQNDDCKLNLANSIWFNENSQVEFNKDFLQTNADYYGAEIYKSPFDNSTCDDINNWVYKETDEMIPEILDEVPEDAIMYLVNALAFDAEWNEVYEDYQVQDHEFTKEDGEKQTTDFMYSHEGTYLEDENATGFMKRYKGRKYAFVALLPNEGVTVSEYIESLDGESLYNLLGNSEYHEVKTATPKFEVEYDTEMSEVLENMGMPLAFDDDEADFSNIGTVENAVISISRVLHKTFITVNENGTRASAATVVEIEELASAFEPEEKPEPKEVYLYRPFVYMIVDCENNIPLFMGTIMDVK